MVRTSTIGRALARTLHAAYALSIASAIVVPTLPARHTGAVGVWLRDTLRQVSVQQSWRMYAPDPVRSHAYMNLTAEFADGSHVELEETAQEQPGWGTTYALAKTRLDIWRYYANLRPKERNVNRTWYLYGVCVREARKPGPHPVRIVMTVVTRRFTSPRKVREGAAPLGPPQRREVARISCNHPTVLRMIEGDRLHAT